MSNEKRPYDSTVARMAGNIAGSLAARNYNTTTILDGVVERIALDSIAIAECIVKKLTAKAVANRDRKAQEPR